MHPFIYYILIFLLIGALGMAMANRKVNTEVQRQRWLKFFTYALIMAVILTTIFLKFFPWLGILIVTVCLIELVKVNVEAKKEFSIRSLLFYSQLALCFVLFTRDYSSMFVLYIYFQVLVFDAFGQITGQLFGKHLLLPSISPGKTTEGLIGAFICCIIAACLGASWAGEKLPLVAGLFTAVACFCGDIIASWFKRKRNIKDYSNWLPGQGGFLDRFDSFIFAGAAWYIFKAIVYISI